MSKDSKQQPGVKPIASPASSPPPSPPPPFDAPAAVGVTVASTPISTDPAPMPVPMPVTTPAYDSPAMFTGNATVGQLLVVAHKEDRKIMDQNSKCTGQGVVIISDSDTVARAAIDTFYQIAIKNQNKKWAADS